MTVYPDNTKIFPGGMWPFSDASGIPKSSDYSDWDYRSIWTVPGNGSVVTDAVIRLVVNYDSDMESDFGDLRFTDKDCAAIPHYTRLKLDDNWAVVHVKIASLPADGTYIQMYFGKTGESALNTSVYDTNLTTAFGGVILDPKYDVDTGDAGAVAEGSGYMSITNPSSTTQVSSILGVGAGCHAIDFVIETSDITAFNFGLINTDNDNYLFLSIDTNTTMYSVDDSGTDTGNTVAVLTAGTPWYVQIVRDTANSRAWFVADTTPFLPQDYGDLSKGFIAGTKAQIMTSLGHINDDMSRSFFTILTSMDGVVKCYDLAAYKYAGGANAPKLAWKEGI